MTKKELNLVINSVRQVFRVSNRYPDLKNGIVLALNGLIEGLEKYRDNKTDAQLDTYVTWYILRAVDPSNEDL